MAEKKTRSAAATAAERGSGELTDDERAAMQERAREAKRSGKTTPAEDEAAVVEKIAGMAPPDRAMAERLHALIRAAVPEIASKLWYGMPAYAKGGKTICHFQDAAKFKTRYATLGFSDAAKLDDGAIWPVAFALLELTPEVEARITELVKRAAG
jgi:uncharacterized protein YdhG (YjbR/CyaY superfamily)